MSWGIKIAALYIGFVLMIGALIFRSSLENIDLETADYYEQELRFQDQIDGREELLKSGQQPVIGLSENSINIELPADLSQSPTGKINFYRPDNAALDWEQPITSTTSVCPMNKFKTGQYRVRVNWVDSGKAYFFETQIYIP